MKLIATLHSNSGHSAKVYRDTEWNEFRVKFYSPSGLHREIEDHHTDDKEDALGTARLELDRKKVA